MSVHEARVEIWVGQGEDEIRRNDSQLSLKVVAQGMY